MESLCAAMVLNKKVKRLILKENWMTGDLLDYLATIIGNNECIEYLSLKECRIGPVGAQVVKEAIANNRIIKELDLSYNSLGDEGLIKLKDGLKSNQFIKKLNLSHNELGEKSGAVLAEIFTENDTLVDVDLSWNTINSDDCTHFASRFDSTKDSFFAGCKELFAALTENKFVKILRMAWNYLESRLAVIALLKYLKGTEVLEELHLESNRLSHSTCSLMRFSLFTY